MIIFVPGDYTTTSEVCNQYFSENKDFLEKLQQFSDVDKKAISVGCAGNKELQIACVYSGL